MGEINDTKKNKNYFVTIFAQYNEIKKQKKQNKAMKTDEKKYCIFEPENIK